MIRGRSKISGSTYSKSMAIFLKLMLILIMRRLTDRMAIILDYMRSILPRIILIARLHGMIGKMQEGSDGTYSLTKPKNITEA